MTRAPRKDAVCVCVCVSVSVRVHPCSRLQASLSFVEKVHTHTKTKTSTRLGGASLIIKSLFHMLHSAALPPPFLSATRSSQSRPSSLQISIGKGTQPVLHPAADSLLSAAVISVFHRRQQKGIRSLNEKEGMSRGEINLFC